MMDKDDISDDIEVEYLEPEVADEEEDVITPAPKRGFELIPLLGVGVLATLLGAIGGAFGAQYLLPKTDFSSVEARLERQIAEVKDAKNTDISTLQKSIQTLRKQTIDNMDNPQINTSIAALEARLLELENTPTPSLPDVSPETLAALQAAQADGFNWPDMSEVELELADAKAELALLHSKIEALETRSLSFAPEISAATAPTGKTDMGVEFPETALLAALETKVDEKGLIARTLSKHINVREPDDPLVLIETAVNALERGDLPSAKAAFDKLPEDIRVVGQAWRESVN